MSTPDRPVHQGSQMLQAQSEPSDAEKRRDDTLTRIRGALLEERLSVLAVSGENCGTDPYNSGIHRALAKTQVWSKRSR